jgi:drug/metabolite transporter (DMT)-like permease
VRNASVKLAVAALLLNALIWGVSWWPLRQLEFAGLHPLWATALIYWFAVVCVLLVRPQTWRAFTGQRGLWLLALASGFTNIGFNWAVTVGDVVRVVLLFYLMPAWAVLLAWRLLGEKPPFTAVLRLGLGLTGVLFVLKKPGAAWPMPESLPDYLALMGGLSFALTNILLRKLRDTPSESRMMAMFGGGAVLATLMAFWGEQGGWVPAIPPIQTTWLLYALGLALAFLVGNLALQYGAARLRSANTSLIMLSEIVFASLSAVWLGAAALDMRTVVGALLIFAAAVWAAMADKEPSTGNPRATP